MDALASVSFLEAYATSYRYGTLTGRVPASPPIGRVAAALDRIEATIATLRQRLAVTPGEGGTAMNTAPRRSAKT